MLTGPVLDNAVHGVIRACRAGLDPDALRASVLPQLRQVVPIDALWWATADPTTLLFTGAFREGLPAESGPYFIDNEFLGSDVNKWTDLAARSAGVATLMRATGDEPSRSGRYRDIFAPLGLADELRAVLRAQGSCWGYLCLHRERAQSAFSAEEAGFIRRIAPHLADGIRTGLVRQSCERKDLPSGPGLILLDGEGGVAGLNQAAGGWLEDLGSAASGDGLPIEIAALALRLRHPDAAEATLPRLRVRTRSGRWAVLHASWFASDTTSTIAVIIEEAVPADAAPMIMLAYGLTERERTIVGVICRGLPTRRIAAELHLSIDTVQDHLKSVFDKTGVRSRGELVAAVLQHDYLRPSGPHRSDG